MAGRFLAPRGHYVYEGVQLRDTTEYRFVHIEHHAGILLVEENRCLNGKAPTRARQAALDLLGARPY
jgi:hypothetical protein